jgi:histidinol dehydrogenase
MHRHLHPPRSEWPVLCTRPVGTRDALEAQVVPILEAVRMQGDAAVRAFTARFDGVEVSDLRVGPEEIAQAGAALSEELKDALRLAKANLERFHAAQVETPRRIETTPGVWCWRRSTPIERVGFYIPGGTAPLFSTVLMLGVPAQLAGCETVVLCTPPDREGRIPPTILFAAHLLGITQVFRAGGAQAIAAMAYGTETIPAVYKIFGPGNQYVTAAKQYVARDGVAIDLPAGPTEVLVLADTTANPVFVAADLLAQAEHGPDSQVVLVTPDIHVVDNVLKAVEAQLATLPRQALARQALENSRAIVVRDLAEAVAFSNAYAPEHLIVAVADAEAIAAQVTNAGSVFLGHLAPESVGDYASGTNHTLPTDGHARAWSGVSVDAFVKKITFQRLTEDGLRALGPAVEVMARAEQLDGHARAVTLRLDAIGRRRSEAAGRRATIHRRTSETDIRVTLDLDGQGRADLHTGLGFFDHMLEQLARHGGFDLTVYAHGDLHIDEHHTIEDTAITLGQALAQALGDKRGIERYGFLLPMDDALAQVALDLSGRSWLVWDVPFARERLGDVPTELFHHFFKSLTDVARFNLNVKAEGDNDHHKIEAVFKGVARALRMAVRRDAASDTVPSTKGLL